MRTRLSVLLPLLALGCGGTLPEPVYANQVDAYFPEDSPAREDAERCARRLNGHRGDAEAVLVVQGLVNGVGGATGAVGGVLAAVDLNDPDVTTAMGVMASIGAGISLVGNLFLGLLANPQEELRRHGLGERSWSVAVELQSAGSDPEAVRTALQRCARDEAPPARVEGTGDTF